MILWDCDEQKFIITVWKFITFNRAYEHALEAYVEVADGDNVDRKRENSGKGIKGWLKDLWSAFILVDALLIAASITPFSQAATQASTARTPSGNVTYLGALLPHPADCKDEAVCTYRYTTFGVLWTLTLGMSIYSLAVSMLLLGSLVAQPDQHVHEWATGLPREYLSLPAMTALAGTATFIIAVGYSAAVYYGRWAAVTAGIIGFLVVVTVVVDLIAGGLHGRLLPSKRPRSVPPTSGGHKRAGPVRHQEALWNQYDMKMMAPGANGVCGAVGTDPPAAAAPPPGSSC